MHAFSCGLPVRKHLCAVIAIACALPAFSARGGTVTGAGNSAIVNTNSPVETWTALDHAALVVDGGQLLRTVVDTGATLTMTNGTASATTNLFGAAVELHDGATATITGSRLVNDSTGRGLSLQGAAPSSATLLGSTVTGGTDGILLSGGGTLTLDQATRSEGTLTTASGVRISNGTANILGGSTAYGQQNGIIIADDTRGISDLGRLVVVDASASVGVTGSAIRVQDISGPTRPNVASIELRNGAKLVGGNGVAIEALTQTEVTVGIEGSHISGDMLAVDDGVLDINLNDSGAAITGRMIAVNAMTQAAGSTWNVTGDSDLRAYTLNGGTLAFQPGTDGSHRATTVHGDLAGSGGTIAFNTVMNEGGALASQATDRLLIEGNVTTTGPVAIVVTPSGVGASSDRNTNGLVGADEGISLIQVAGTSRADAFVLRGGYVAVGPYSYTLHAFGPGTTDQAQNALATGSLNWDYRLGAVYVCQTDCDPVDPTTPPVDPGEPPVDPIDPPPGGRVAVVPQLPSYLSAPAALLTYGDMMNDGLHQRLGDLRTGTSHDPIGGEVFARYLGGQLRYSSNLSFQRYGYDFDQQVNALQVGGSLIALDGDNGTLRAGWAADHGTTRVTPKAADGNSSAKYRANGMSAWITWQQGNGLWVDGVLGSTSYSGDVGTDLRGADVGRVRANGWTMSVETGMPFALGNDWTVEPRFQLKHQSLNFRDFTDGDGLDVRLGTAKQTSATLGGRIMRTANRVFMPYANLDLTHTSNGDPNADVSSADWDLSQRFGSGRVGNAYKVAAGAVSQLSEHVQVYGEGTYQHFVGSYGMQGWAGNVGIRVTF
ncbi:outer membrane autotransporter protein [Luteibacter sp. OK325]|uniref:autotransporter family protein n=1 Tax=Luteibacter sp. OK325 TaxID=2135670 RepID=UPI000D3A6E6E|nr:autotransporter outer membrane beta-barrel domain-containing protein [Luteibacter sp. OK325]PTR33847.1 outer membrane autotransporter protein [Luteibacter sp. OK325]